MGSKLRKLRQKAGVTGHAYQAKQRSQERARMRARELGSQIALSAKYPGASAGPELHEARFLGLQHPAFNDIAFQIERQKRDLALLVGDSDAQRIFGEAVDYARTTTELNSDVIMRELGKAIALRRASRDLTAELTRIRDSNEAASSIVLNLDSPGGAVHSLDDLSAASAIAIAGDALSPPPAPPAPAMRPNPRMSPLATVAMISMLLGGLALPGEEDP